MFRLVDPGKHFRNVELCGTFDEWKKRHRLRYDGYTSQWFIALHLKNGVYQYKYIVDGHWRVNDKEGIKKDSAGNVNNIIYL